MDISIYVLGYLLELIQKNIQQFGTFLGLKFGEFGDFWVFFCLWLFAYMYSSILPFLFLCIVSLSCNEVGHFFSSNFVATNLCSWYIYIKYPCISCSVLSITPYENLLKIHRRLKINEKGLGFRVQGLPYEFPRRDHIMIFSSSFGPHFLRNVHKSVTMNNAQFIFEYFCKAFPIDFLISPPHWATHCAFCALGM